MQNILVSVIMPVYNAGRYLRYSMDSILRQTYSTIEFIILNDGSTDDSVSIINSFNDTRIILVSSTENRGLVYQLNTGLSLAKGKYIARMDADDIARHNRIELQVAFLEANQDVGLCGSNVVSFQQNKRYFRSILPSSHDQICTYFLFGNIIVHPSIMVRRSVLQDNQLTYTKDTDTTEDFVLYIDLHKKTRLANIQKVLLEYRLHNNNVSKTNSKGQQDIAAAARRKYVTSFFLAASESNVAERVDQHMTLSSKTIVTSEDLVLFFEWIRFLMYTNSKNHLFEQKDFNRGVAHFIYRKLIRDKQTTFGTLRGWILNHWIFFAALPAPYQILFVLRCFKSVIRTEIKTK